LESLNTLDAFTQIVETRRSVRLFEKTPIPPEVVERALDLALLSPNSSNLQPWEFYWIQAPQKKEQLIKACFSQAAASTAAELIVCVARTATWKRNCDHMREELKRAHEQGIRIPKAATLYYEKTAPFMYNQGLFGTWGLFKRLFFQIMSLFRPTPKEPCGNTDMKLWATKSTALACQTFMLAIRAFGYDTCPMEGIDSSRVRRLLDLPKDSLIPMVIAVGKRRPEGVTLPRIRGPRSWFIKIV
jgi:nitroreductase